MLKSLLIALDWSEVWATLIPLLVLCLRPKQPTTLNPIRIYVLLAFILNLVIDLIAAFKNDFPSWPQSNNPYYNLQSVVRFICFSIYFIKLPQASFHSLRKLLPIVSLIFFVVNFGFIENFLEPQHLSGNLLAAEAYLLLIYCMQYYLSALREDSVELPGDPNFWVVTGLCVYLVVNFFVFLFYVPMIRVDLKLAENIWNIHNLAYIIFCTLLAKAFYGPLRPQHTI